MSRSALHVCFIRLVACCWVFTSTKISPVLSFLALFVLPRMLSRNLQMRNMGSNGFGIRRHTWPVRNQFQFIRPFPVFAHSQNKQMLRMKALLDQASNIHGQVSQECVNPCVEWAPSQQTQCQQCLPFWNNDKVQRRVTSLCCKRWTWIFFSTSTNSQEQWTSMC